MSQHPKVAASFSVIARAPFQVYYEGPAKVVSAQNQVGRFDILPGHADFFSILTPGEVMIGTDAEPVIFQISNGIISVHGQQVELFVNM